MVIVRYFLRHNPLSLHRLLFPIRSKDILYALSHTQEVHIIAFDGPVVDHCLEWKIAQTANAPTVQVRSDDQNLHRWTLYRLSYVPLSMGK